MSQSLFVLQKIMRMGEHNTFKPCWNSEDELLETNWRVQHRCKKFFESGRIADASELLLYAELRKTCAA